MSSIRTVRLLYRNVGSPNKASSLWPMPACSCPQVSSRSIHSQARRCAQLQEQPSDQTQDCNEPGHEADIYNRSLQGAKKSANPIPWYIRLQPSTIPASSISDVRHVLPEIPQDSPPILEPLLQHLSDDLGLESLTLLDLRELDPPPALGANLLMIFGSARSEQHLHVSADRLCRWLRANYLLKPYADGLLGRNELKLKLKRKARRSKLLRAVGSKLVEEPDDGIRTGWICVDTGAVESQSPQAAYAHMSEPDLVGFRTPSYSAKVVIQIMTEGKREQTDLESLWQNMRKRQQSDTETRSVGSFS